VEIDQAVRIGRARGFKQLGSDHAGVDDFSTFNEFVASDSDIDDFFLSEIVPLFVFFSATT